MIKTLCIGEILWDIFPDKKVWGGAPANFIFHTAQFGADATAYTAIGNDPLGQELLSAVKQSQINLHAERVSYPTGKVDISLDTQGVATYTFNENCAWDHIPTSETLIKLSQEADLIAFGSLAQRNEISQATIAQALKSKKASAKVLFDINLRQNFYTKEIIHQSLLETDFFKLNEDEIVIVKELLGKDIKQIFDDYQLELIILTMGAEGSRIITAKNTFNYPATLCKIVDTVGAGDSFTASFIINYLNGVEIKVAQELASKVAAYVCSHSGATITIPEEFKLITTKEI
jgi:fructokinase